jgi:hypothetical protein
MASRRLVARFPTGTVMAPHSMPCVPQACQPGSPG